MSKADDLRGFVTQRLAAAAQEICAVLERTISGYEEEASGFRQQIDLQRRQLEVLLHPRVKPSKAGVKRSRSVGSAEEEECEDEEDEPPVHAENLEHSTDQTPTRGHSKKMKAGRPQISGTQSHVDLRIRILEDSQTEVLSNSLLKRCPMQRLKCPPGLQEADFLDLLSSSFPQLSGDDKRFDILTSDKRRRLQPLKLKTVTPEEIHRNISCTGSGRSTLFIRLKNQKKPQVSEKETRPLQTEDDNAEDSLCASAMLTCDETRPETRSSAQEVDGSSTSQRLDLETEEADDEDQYQRMLEPVEEDLVACCETKGDGSDDVEKEGEREDSDDDWKPETTKKQKAGCSSVKNETKTENSNVVFSCRVCGTVHESEVLLVKHAWSHEDDPGSLCGVCGELPESVEALKDHLQSHHHTDDCHICGESFLGGLGLDEHVAAHSGEKPYECDVCREAFALKASLEDHRQLHKANKQHRCYTCHKVFELRDQLKAHCRTHTSKKTHLCGVCGKSLSDYRSLSRHKMTHSGERPHSCQVCGRRFKLPGTLRQHEKIHTDRERLYLCDVCCKMFLTSKQLQIHMRTHTNEKPYHCGECGKGFTTKGPLTIHMRVHTGETPYRCPDCGWSFKRKINLDNHVTVHSGNKPFVCGICGKACARKSYLTVHMRTHNGERPYKCSLCDKAFTQSHCLKTHMKSHLVGEAAT